MFCFLGWNYASYSAFGSNNLWNERKNPISYYYLLKGIQRGK